MFRTSDSEDDMPQHSRAHGASNTRDRMNLIAHARRADMKETFAEEMESISRKRRFNSDKEETLSDSDSPDDDKEEVITQPPEAKKPKNIGEALMAKMGHKAGEGLGKSGQGRVEPVGMSTQRGRVGLGHEATKQIGRDFSETWDESVEDKTHAETVEWMEKCPDEAREAAAEECEVGRWMEEGPTKKKIDDETEFCSEELLHNMLKAKDVFDHLSDRELREARTRANPYETIGSAFFQNRAAMKTANLDKVFDWMFSQEDSETILKKNPINLNAKGVNTDRDKPLFYFADVCAGPGGFSEYMLWRKGFYNTKGFGFTLAGKDDFKLEKFNASSPFFFEAFYGKHNDGDVMNPENIDSLEEFIMKGTEGKGVHLMMADGGFSVEGQENIQEILSKRLYLCQLLVSLCIVREGGNFFCKLFDIFTPFSAGLIYLMRVCYDEISLHKPHTSRPANSERYIICRGLRKEFSDRVRDYLKKVNRKLDDIKKQGREETADVVACVPLDVLRDDDAFFNYLVKHNDGMALRQTTYLNKYLSFARNQGLIDKDQGDLREKCLEYWQVPNKPRPRFGDQQRQQGIALDILGRYSPTVFGDADLVLKIPSFTIDIFANPLERQMKYAEWGCTFISERSPPKLLVSVKNVCKVYDRMSWQDYDRSQIRIPENTILFVEIAGNYKIENNKLVEKSKILRIIDAAVLNGDDVSRLSYANRLKAAEKFCRALERVVPTIEMRFRPREAARKFTPYKIVVAKLFHPDGLPKMKENLKFLRHRGSDIVTIEENDMTLTCNGVRFARLIKNDFTMNWSNSNGRPYAYKLEGKVSVFEGQFEKFDVWASFWDVCLMKKNRPGAAPQAISQCFWKWENSLEDNYGYKVIMESDEHKSGPTLKTVEDIISTTKRQLNIPHS